MKEKDKVFISYTTRDNLVDKDFLGQLNNFLIASFVVFIDYLHNDSKEKQIRIEKELANSDFLILIKTQQTFYSEWVIKEIEIAKNLSIPIFEFDFYDLKNNNFEPITAALNQWRNL
jgi:hypothetical protein